jgi:hypothetical protein
MMVPSMVTERSHQYSARLLIDWLNARYESDFRLTEASGDAFMAVDGEGRAAVFVAPLWDDDETWSAKLRAIEQRLAAAAVDGAFILWVPPKAAIPSEEPDASDFVERVVAVAREMPAGARAEVTFPVQVTLGKMRDEGGYASVIGGLSRWWTRITEKVNGTFHVEASRVHRITRDGEAREKLWDNIGALSHGIQVGQAADFSVDEAWTLQRLPDATPSEGQALAWQAAGLAIIGAPPDIDSADGVLLRRGARKRLAEANDALGSLDVATRCVGLVASYEYADLEGVSSVVKALTPSLFSGIDLICVITDGEVRPTFAPKAL